MAILGYAEIVAADARTGRVVPEDADQIVTAARRAMDLTSRLRDLARRPAGEAEPTDLRALVEAVLRLAARLVPERIEIAPDLAPVPPTRLDRAAFEQALLNLIVNAIDAMPEGGLLTVTTRVDPQADPTRPVVVAVADTGVGMDEATQRRAFEAFFTTKPLGMGTGLGLAMVYAAVERVGGRIEVRSAPGAGATFTIRSPAVERGAAPAGAAQSESTSLPGGSERVLVVEDDPGVRGEIERVLGRLGYRVTAVTRPSEALAAAVAGPVDLVISDVVLPEMSGPALATELRASNPDVPVVLMSGYRADLEAPEDERPADRPGTPIDLVLEKPVSVAELARAVRTALDARSR